MRPSMGGPGIQPQTQKGQGPMGILMPLYTVGIVCFFVYTIMKVIHFINLSMSIILILNMFSDYIQEARRF